MFYQELCQTKIVDLSKANNFASLRFFVFHILFFKKIEFWIFNSIFLNLFKFVDLYVENNFL